VNVQIRELNEKVKEMELEIVSYKRKCEESDTKLKDLKQLFVQVRSDRNLCSKNVLEANVSCTVLLPTFYRH